MKTTTFFAFASVLLLASCKFVSDWAGASSDAPGDVVVPPSDVQTPNTLPVWGGDGWLDLVVTALSVLGLAPAARLVALAKPLIAPLIIVLAGKKKQEPQAPAN